MSRLSRGLSGLAARVGLAPGSAGRGGPDASWRWPLDQALLARLDRVVLEQRRAASGGLGGDHRSRARAASTDFVDHRAYAPGDDFRQIDWHAYGRLEQLYVRQTEARERLPMLLLLDCSASMGSGDPSKFDLARQLAAVLGYVGLARYDRVTIVPLGDRPSMLRPLQGRQRFAELLAALDRLEPAGSLRFDLLTDDPRLRGGRGQAVLLSDMLHPDGYLAGLTALQAGGLAPAVVQVLSRQELEPDQDGDLELIDVESGERVLVGLSPTAAATYLRRLEAWCEGVAQSCAARRLRYIRVVSDQPLDRLALFDFRQAGLLR
jgi:uncharacterized protein (DUF58 family)